RPPGHHAAPGERPPHRAPRHRLALLDRAEPQRDAAVVGRARALDPDVGAEAHLAVVPEAQPERVAGQAARTVAAELRAPPVRLVVPHPELVALLALDQHPP